MKKSTIIIAIGIFIIVTAALGMNNKKMYQKQKHFETADEVIQQLKDNPLMIIDKEGNLSETDELKECLSERKRLTYSYFNYGKIDIKNIDNLNETEKKGILQKYEILRSNFSKRRPITKEEPIRLTIDAYYSDIEEGTVKYKNAGEKLNLDLILIDEGEGLVIDYVMENSRDKFREKGNEDA
jgi:hypothetical protein